MLPNCPKLVLTLAVGLLAVGCQSSRNIIDESLSEPHPAEVSGRVAPPPVAPAALAIAASSYGPTETPRVAPEPILPKMDGQFKERRMPAGYEAFTDTTTRPASRPVLPPAPEVDR